MSVIKKSKRIDLLLPENNAGSRRLYTGSEVDEKGRVLCSTTHQRLQGYEALILFKIMPGLRVLCMISTDLGRSGKRLGRTDSK